MAGTVFRKFTAPLIAAAAVGFAAAPMAEAHSHGHRSAAHHTGHSHRYAAAGHVIQCVAFAKQASDVELSGNAANWWQNAAGVYARGHAPEVGSVLNFRANGRMRLGHVAVVTDVVNSRTIQIDQSHWNSRGISRDVSVIDVSENNDWTAVRVELAHNNTYGSIYPTYGFIYARPDESGRVIEASSDAAPLVVNPAPSDLRHHRGMTEVAEMPATTRGIDTTLPLALDDAPSRNLR